MLPAITNLHGLSKDPGSVGDSARSALVAINRVISERKDLKIINAEGSDLTEIGVFRKELDGDVGEGGMGTDDVIRTARGVAGFRRKVAVGMNKAARQRGEPAVLLTEVANMRKKANGSGVPAISRIVLNNYLLMHRSNGQKRSNAKMRPNRRGRLNRGERKKQSNGKRDKRG